VGFLFLAFVLLPFAELFILIRIGRVVGAWYTLLGVIAVGLLGAYLAKRQGLRVIRDWQDALNQGRLPEEGLVGGILALVGCVLLITPGILTDVMGLALLLPVTRRAIVPFVKRAIDRRMQNGSLHVQTIAGMPFGPSRGAPPPRSHGGVIDTEGEDVTSKTRRVPSGDA
jgi:UPF0716 protein FxsA